MKNDLFHSGISFIVYPFKSIFTQNYLLNSRFITFVRAFEKLFLQQLQF